MFPLSSDDGHALLNIARRAISSAVVEKCIPDLSNYPPALRACAGAFVTIYSGARLRGCMGQSENTNPLADAVARAAINAALHDPRFTSVTVNELATMEIAVSVLSPPKAIAPEAIVPGRHGVLVVCRERRGLLLPQVAVERKWSGQQLLEETCIKAGLCRDAWQVPQTQVLGFTTEVFSEEACPVGSGF